jgi:hypothetical protein
MIVPMPTLPVPIECLNCRQTYALPFNYAPRTWSTFTNCFVRGGCPRCGEEGGGILHGVYGFVEQAIEMLRNGALTAAHFEAVREILSLAETSQATAD